MVYFFPDYCAFFLMCLVIGYQIIEIVSLFFINITSFKRQKFLYSRLVKSLKRSRIIMNHIVRSLNNPTFTNHLTRLISSLVGCKFELALFVFKYVVFCFCPCYVVF